MPNLGLTEGQVDACKEAVGVWILLTVCVCARALSLSLSLSLSLMVHVVCWLGAERYYNDVKFTIQQKQLQDQLEVLIVSLLLLL